MSFTLPKYTAPDFTEERFVNAPDATYIPAEADGVAPDNFHSTSMYPEYFKVNGQWLLAEESRMDSCVVLRDDGTLAVIEGRNLKKGDKVFVGRTDRCEEGIYLHSKGFEEENTEDTFDVTEMLSSPKEETHESTASSPIEAFLNALGDKKREFVFAALNEDPKMQKSIAKEIGTLPDALADTVNELAAEILGDIILEDNGDFYEIIEDYRELFEND